MEQFQGAPPFQLDELRKWSAHYGSDRMLTQGAGGNTSFKDGGWLWVKASGTWLQDALTSEIFVPCPIAGIRAGIDSGEDRKAEWTTPSGRRLRSSIETSLHAVVPDPWVFHVHSVASMLWSAVADGRREVEDRLAGLPWEWIRYDRPGLPLTISILDRLGSRPRVLILENHGLVVSGESCEEVDELLREVEARLAVPARVTTPPATAELEAVCPPGYHPARYEGSHCCATGAVEYSAATLGMPAPDFAVFLGAELVGVRAGESLEAAAAEYRNRYRIDPSVFLIEGKGALVRDTVSENGELMLEALGRMLSRLPEGRRLTYLPLPEILALLEWDAEKYRQSVTKE